LVVDMVLVGQQWVVQVDQVEVVELTVRQQVVLELPVKEIMVDLALMAPITQQAEAEELALSVMRVPLLDQEQTAVLALVLLLPDQECFMLAVGAGVKILLLFLLPLHGVVV